MCMCTYVCTCIMHKLRIQYTYLYIYMYNSFTIYRCVCMYGWMDGRMYVCMYVCVCVCVCGFAFVYRLFIYLFIYLYSFNYFVLFLCLFVFICLYYAYSHICTYIVVNTHTYDVDYLFTYQCHKRPNLPAATPSLFWRFSGKGLLLAFQLFPYSYDRPKRVFQQHVARSQATWQLLPQGRCPWLELNFLAQWFGNMRRLFINGTWWNYIYCIFFCWCKLLVLKTCWREHKTIHEYN